MRTHKKFRCDACRQQAVTCNVVIDDYDLPIYLAICDGCGLKGSVKDSIREAIEDHQREANPKDAAEIDWQQVNEIVNPEAILTKTTKPQAYICPNCGHDILTSNGKENGFISSCHKCKISGVYRPTIDEALASQAEECSKWKGGAYYSGHSIYSIDIQPKSGEPMQPLIERILRVVNGLKEKVKVLEAVMNPPETECDVTTIADVKKSIPRHLMPLFDWVETLHLKHDDHEERLDELGELEKRVENLRLYGGDAGRERALEIENASLRQQLEAEQLKHEALKSLVEKFALLVKTEDAAGIILEGRPF